MYCDRCGTPIASGAQFCSSCGKQVGVAAAAGAPPPVNAAVQPDGRVQRHIQLLATLWLANGILRFVEVGSIFIAGRILPYLAGWPFSAPFANWPFDWMSFGLYAVGGFLAFFGLIHILLAWGLFERQPWARTLGVVVGILALFRPPLGTALGIYTLWVLLPAHSSQEYDRLSRASI